MLKPFAVFEEVRGIVLVEIIPPFRGVRVEPGFRTVSFVLGRWPSRDFGEAIAIQIGAKDIADLFRS